VDHKLKLGCLLYRQISWFSTLQDLVDINCSAAIEIDIVDSIRHQTAFIDICPLVINSGQAVFVGKFHEQIPFGEKLSGGCGHNGANLFLLRKLESSLN